MPRWDMAAVDALDFAQTRSEALKTRGYDPEIIAANGNGHEPQILVGGRRRDEPLEALVVEPVPALPQPKPSIDTKAVSVDSAPERTCPQCGAPVEGPDSKRYCSDRCRRRSHRPATTAGSESTGQVENPIYAVLAAAGAELLRVEVAFGSQTWVITRSMNGAT